MNPAEEIVKFWLQQNGYFIQSSIRVPNGYNREIDILALHEKLDERRHIEVSVSIRMQAINHDVETLAAHFAKKFEHSTVVTEVQRRFDASKPYTKELVVGEVKISGQDALTQFIAACDKYGITVITIEDILNDIVPKLGGQTQLNAVIKTLQIAHKFPCSNTR